MGAADAEVARLRAELREAGTRAARIRRRGDGMAARVSQCWAAGFAGIMTVALFHAPPGMLGWVAAALVAGFLLAVGLGLGATLVAAADRRRRRAALRAQLAAMPRALRVSTLHALWQDAPRGTDARKLLEPLCRDLGGAWELSPAGGPERLGDELSSVT